MRGKVLGHAVLSCLHRITPAYAGKRRNSKNFYKIKRDHPRLCGEKMTVSGCGKSNRGSPPPMRGKVPEQGLIRLRDGITPAYAGKRWRELPEKA